MTESRTDTAGPGPVEAAGRPVFRATARMARPFAVQVASLRKETGDTRVVERAGMIEGLASVGVFVPEGQPVQVALTLASYPGGITARGTVRAPWVGECRRCGGPVEGTLEARVGERYAPVGGTEADEDAYPLVGDELNLEPLARDAILLELPLAPLCSPDCLGLCPQCGTNWNLGPCSCPPAADPRWSALDALREP